MMVLSIPTLYCGRLKRNKICSLTSYNFYISNLILKPGMTVVVVHNCLLRGWDHSFPDTPDGHKCLWSWKWPHEALSTLEMVFMKWDHVKSACSCASVHILPLITWNWLKVTVNLNECTDSQIKCCFASFTSIISLVIVGEMIIRCINNFWY